MSYSDEDDEENLKVLNYEDESFRWIGKILFPRIEVDHFLFEFIGMDEDDYSHRENVIKCGNLKLFKCFKTSKSKMDNDVSLMSKYGHTHMLKWMQRACGNEFYRLLKNAALQAAHFDKFEVLKWLYDRGAPLVDAIWGAALGGHVHIMKWIMDRESDYREKTFEYAARGGCLEMVKFLFENDCKMGADDANRAAQGGHLDVLKFIMANGGTWNQWAADWASQKGHHETFKWIIENGGTCSKYAKVYAKDSRMESMVESYRYANRLKF